MSRYQDPNASIDAPVKKQIFLVLLGFAAVTALIAFVINNIV